MKISLHKLRSRSGETLAETLVSALIIALSILLMTSMVLTSMNLNTEARALDKALYAEMGKAEDATPVTDAVGSGKTVEVCFKDTSPSSSEVPVTVNLYGTEGGLISYGK